MRSELQDAHSDPQHGDALAQPSNLARVRVAIERLTPFAIAVLFAALSLRGAWRSDIVNSDGARHAMNGVLIYDLIRGGHLANPIEFAEQYYSHLPAISLPYHPPLFPAIEACCFALMGVEVSTARIAVASAVALCAMFLYKLVMREYASHVLAAAATCTFLSALRLSVVLETDVYLEFPALACVFASLFFFREVNGAWRLRDGLAFALLGGAAVWTKQHAVYVGLVPFVSIVLSRRWHLLIGKTLWISTTLFALLCIGLMSISFAYKGMGVVGQVPPADVQRFAAVSVWKVGFYATAYIRAFGYVPGILCAAAVIYYLLGRCVGRVSSARNDLMLSCVVGVLAMLMVVEQPGPRYVFLAYPAVIAVAYSGLFDLAHRLTSKTGARAVVAITAIVMFAGGARIPPSFMVGVGDTAKFVVEQGAKRVLYCGFFDGSFAFACRTQTAPLEFVVVRGDRLDPATFDAAVFEDFAARHGLEYIIFEKTKSTAAWDKLISDGSPHLKLEHVTQLRVAASRTRGGELLVYRFTNPSRDPERFDQLKLMRSS